MRKEKKTRIREKQGRMEIKGKNALKKSRKKNRRRKGKTKRQKKRKEKSKVG
jgi:hypothetical protein